jgi:hypothetical protein
MYSILKNINIELLLNLFLLKSILLLYFLKSIKVELVSFEKSSLKGEARIILEPYFPAL